MINSKGQLLKLFLQFLPFKSNFISLNTVEEIMTTLTQYTGEIFISGLSRSERDELLEKISLLMKEMGIEFDQRFSIKTATVVTLGDCNYEIDLR